MRSSVPMPGNPWPHDMVITVEDDSQPLLELLWIREAWQLDPEGGDLPPLLVDTPASLGASQRSGAPIREWRAAWPRVWTAVLQHAGTVRAPDIFDRLQASENSDERARLLRELVGSSWQEEVDAEAITDETQQWMHSQFKHRTGRSLAGWGAQPEHLALETLIDAWRCGLTKIVEIPCRGTFTRRIGAHAILVTAETRADPARYRSALTEFC
ncbi:MAG TPA: hypothetical protein VGO88_04200 [Mycetocola sp.]|nr:hypothetical protein [Mycetocola sp.]